MSENNLSLTIGEVQALKKVLGYVLYHTSPELYSVATKLEDIYSQEVNYDDVVFFKNDQCGAPDRAYKHRNISIAIQ